MKGFDAVVFAADTWTSPWKLWFFNLHNLLFAGCSWLNRLSHDCWGLFFL